MARKRCATALCAIDAYCTPAFSSPASAASSPPVKPSSTSVHSPPPTLAPSLLHSPSLRRRHLHLHLHLHPRRHRRRPPDRHGHPRRALSRHRPLNTALLARLRDLPGLTAQLRALVLTLSARPSAVFALPLRAHPPTLITSAPLPPPSPEAPRPFADTLRRLFLRALATALRIPPDTFIEADPATATLLQSLLPAALGGINIPDPAALATPSFLASIADTLPILSSDHILAPALLDPTAWPSSKSLTLRSAHAAFHSIVSLPTFAAIASNPSAESLHRAIPSLLTAPNGRFSITLLASCAGRRSQSTFTHAVFSHLLERVLASPTIQPLVAARLRHSAAPQASTLFTMYYLPKDVQLTDLQTQFLYLHRLGVPLPFIPSPPPAFCHPNCKDYPPCRPITPGHALFPHLAHALHHMACGVGGFRHRRHDVIVRIIAAAARAELHADASTKSRLASSATRGTKVDLVITSYDLWPHVIAIDATVSNPLLPSHSAKAAKNAATMFADRNAEKCAKHLPGCVELSRAFLSVVYSTLGGVGPPDSRAWLDPLYNVSYAAELIAGGTGQQTARRRQLLYQTLHASLVRSTTDMIVALTSPTHAP